MSKYQYSPLTKQEISRTLDSLKFKHDLTMKQICRVLAVDWDDMNAYIAGDKTPPPSLRILLALADANDGFTIARHVAEAAMINNGGRA